MSEHFDKYIWPMIIEPVIRSVERSVSEDFIKNISWKNLMYESEYKQCLSQVYEEKRDWLKQTYFSVYNGSRKENRNGNEKYLDLHKIAAVICRALIKCKPYSFDVQQANQYLDSHPEFKTDFRWVVHNYFANYRVAVEAAFTIALFDMANRMEGTDEKEQSLVNDILSSFLKNGFDLYKEEWSFLKREHEEFFDSVILNVALNDTTKRDFDYLGFATICFQLQQHELMKFQYDQLKKQISE